jgi:predicted ATPase/class 3 adenylate cyclase
VAAPQTVALVMTDVQGSTRLWREAPEAMHAAMARHDAIVAEVLARHGGWRPTDQGEGDSAFLAFQGTRAAVAAAVDLQLAMHAEPWPEPVQLSVRIAVGVGEVYPRDGNLYGDAVNRTARVRGLASGGQTLLTSAVRALVGDELPSGVTLRDLGAHRMKDLIQPEQVFQLDHPDLPSTFPPLPSLDRQPHNLPMQSSSFVGREHDLAELLSLVRDGARLVTITGFGGIGKTRLALQAAAELIGSATDGVWFVDCSAAVDPDDVPVAVASTLGVRDPGLGMAAAVLDFARERSLVLVLDNLEQVTDAAHWVGELLSAAPGVRVLATSREPLRLRDEVDYRLEPLGTPPAGHSHDGAQFVAEFPAVKLFLDRARQAMRTFTLNDATAPDVADICSQLDGLPLAIELAAARVKVLSPADLLVRLQLGVPLPPSGERDRPQRHQTLTAAIDWSVGLLSEDERTLLGRMAVLPGSADLRTVEAVCAPDSDLDVVSLLGALVDKSLVRRSDDGGRARFSILTTIRDVMLARLTPEERDRIADRHLAHFLERSVVGAASSDSRDSGPWDVEKHSETHHFRAAIARARSTCRAHDELLLVANLADLWLEQHLREGLTLLQRARASAERAGVDDVALLAFAASLQAFLLAWSADFVAGLPVAEEGVRLAEQPGGDEVRAFAYQARSEVQGDLALRREDFLRAIRLAQADPHRASRWGGARPESVELGVASALASLDRFVDPAGARDMARALLDRATAAGRPADVAGAQLLLGYLAADVGDFDSACAVLNQCLDELHASAFSPVQQLHARAQLALVEDRRDGGAAGLEPLLELFQQLEDAGLTGNAIDVLLRVGDRQLLAGELPAARATYLHADELCQAAAVGRAHWARWRLARIDRLAGADTRAALDAAWVDLRPFARRWLPDALSVLVEAALAAEATGDRMRAGALAATVAARRGAFLLRLPVDADFVRLQSECDGLPLEGLPVDLFGAGVASS